MTFLQIFAYIKLESADIPLAADDVVVVPSANVVSAFSNGCGFIADERNWSGSAIDKSHKAKHAKHGKLSFEHSSIRCIMVVRLSQDYDLSYLFCVDYLNTTSKPFSKINNHPIEIHEQTQNNHFPTKLRKNDLASDGGINVESDVVGCGEREMKSDNRKHMNRLSELTKALSYPLKLTAKNAVSVKVLSA
ncbi:hypothetical protein YC2023_094758 [Brassica napus]